MHQTPGLLLLCCCVVAAHTYIYYADNRLPNEPRIRGRGEAMGRRKWAIGVLHSLRLCYNYIIKKVSIITSIYVIASPLCWCGDGKALRSLGAFPIARSDLRAISGEHIYIYDVYTQRHYIHAKSLWKSRMHASWHTGYTLHKYKRACLNAISSAMRALVAAATVACKYVPTTIYAELGPPRAVFI